MDEPLNNRKSGKMRRTKVAHCFRRGQDTPPSAQQPFGQYAAVKKESTTKKNKAASIFFGRAIQLADRIKNSHNTYCGL